MNIFVTGASGFLGYHLCARLLKQGHTITGTMRRAGMASADSKRRLKKLEAIANGGSRLQMARVEEYEGLYNTLQRVRPEVCIHLAGKSWVRESIGYPELYQEANHRYTAALLEALRQNGCRRVIFASTVMVYGKDAPVPYTEDLLGSAPASPYGASKLACEVLMNTYAALYNIETVNLRLFTVYGPDLRQDQVPHLIATAILRNQPFTIFGDGSAMRDYVEVEDVVNAIEAAILGTGSHAALNIGSGFGTTLLELIAEIEKGLGKKCEVVHKPAIAGELTVAVPDITHTMEKLRWEPAVSLEQGIARMLAWFKSADSPLQR
ncbi:MAG TPA: NAD-dependent epimerase/dehydratase family protein [Planctomycetota bacterium]|nr:NAD-dependent epimerase/dehydratase family protein [Planctomycetota bacterium]